MTTKNDDLISREGYKKVIDEQLRFYDPDSSPWHVKILELQRELLDSMPAVDAAPVVHARWIEIEDSWGDCHYQCTECGEEWNLEAGTPVENNMNYCPKCGAKMDGERRDDDGADA